MDRRFPVHRAIVVVDVEGFGDRRRTNRHQVQIRDGLYRATREAFDRTGIPWDSCDHEDRGDGIFILVPAEVPKSLLAESLPRELTAALKHHNSEQPCQQSVRLRMALHAGEVTYDEHGVTGASVNLAFRLLDAKDLKAALARSPGVLAVMVSSWFYEEVVRHTSVAAAYVPVSVTVKETAVTGWMCLPDHLRLPTEERPATRIPATAGSTAESGPPPRALPRDVAAFTGRSRELKRLAAAISRSRGNNTELISVHAVNGMAGIGKTAFAVHAAHQLADRFPDGQIFLRLHAHTPGQRPVDPAEALGTLLLATGFAPWHIPPGLEARSASWRSHLASKRILLVLDDAAGSDQVEPLLPGAPDCLVIVTSRRRLTALEAIPISLDMLPPAEAAHLFVRSAHRPGLRLDDGAVAETVRLCGYLPLAIRLAAARLEHHPAQTVSELAREITSARNESMAMQAEDISVAAAFDLSYQNLTPCQQRMFRRLGVHPGTDIDVRAAAALGDEELAQARREVEALYDQNLLTEPAHGRYRMHDLIRNHARSLADADPAAERDAAIDRLLEYYLRCIRAASSQIERRVPARPPLSIGTPPGHVPFPAAEDDAPAWLEKERQNLLAVVSYAACHGRPRYAAAIAAEMHDFLRTHGHWDTGLGLHQTVAHAVHPVADQPAGSDDQRAEAGALADLGDMQYLTGSFRAANASLRRAEELHRDLHDRLGKANVLSTLGKTQSMIGDTLGAAASYEQALDLYRSVGSVLGEATTLNRLGKLQSLTGPYPVAAANQKQALLLYRSLDDSRGEANVLSNLGTIQSLTGDIRAGTANLEQALELHRDHGNILGEVNALTSLGALQTIKGDYEAAFATLAQSLELRQRLHSRLGEARVLNELGALQSMTGDHKTAFASLARALDLYYDLDYPFGIAQVLNTTGELLLKFALFSDAHAKHEKARITAIALKCLPEEARALEGIGWCHLRDGNSSDGTQSLREAILIYNKVGSFGAKRVQGLLDDYGTFTDPKAPRRDSPPLL
jgi:tetratricopeptide (TPR) repeat protein